MENINYDNTYEVISACVNTGELPPYVYKYTDLETAKIILKNSTIRFSRPYSFNDPFDCQLTINTDNTNEEIEKYANQTAIEKGLSTQQREEFLYQHSNPDERFELTNKSIQDAVKSLKISCFSTVYDNLLMWAHYAEKHCGVVLKFEVLKDASFFMIPYKANYVKNYPVFNYIRDDYFRDSGYLSKLLVETKSLDWLYENEIRVMKPDTDKHNPVDYQDLLIKHEAIVGVIFGCKVEDMLKIEFIQYAKDNGWNNLIFEEAKKKLWDFGLDFTRC